MKKLVHQFLSDSARLTPQKSALFVHNQWFTYARIEQDANKLAHLFIKIGVKRGDRIGFYLENSYEYVVTYYAILKAGAITVALNTELRTENLKYILNDCSIGHFVSNEKMVRKVKDLFGKEFTQTLYIWNATKTKKMLAKLNPYFLPEAFHPENDFPPDIKIIDIDIASIVYTSGSTGKPRGVTLTHLNIVSNTHSIVDYLQLTNQDRIMVILPFYYIYGKSLLNTHFFVGGSVVIDNRFTFPNAVLKTMVEQEVTGFSGVPSTFSILLNHSNFRTITFPSLRYMTQAGGAMAPSLQKKVAEIIKPAELYIMYGATEASARLSYLSPSALPDKWGSIGKAIPNVDLYISDSKGNKLPPGKQGEIVARGSNIMKGYWNHPEETKKVLKNGLYYTGDLGVEDDEGYLYVVGRSKDMIKIGGNRVGSKEIEDALYEMQLVTDAAVIGVPDEVLGEVPKAFVVLADSNANDELKTEATIREFLKPKLASFKIPKYFEFKESLPKNKAGKIRKLVLKENEFKKRE